MTLTPWDAYDVMVLAYSQRKWAEAYVAAAKILEFLKTDAGCFTLKRRQIVITKEVEVNAKRRLIEMGMVE